MNTTKIKTSYGTSKIISLEPTVKTDLRAERIFLVPGFSETLHHNKLLMQELGAIGLSSLTYSPPYRLKDGVGGTPQIPDRQADIIIELIKKSLINGEPINAVAHSLGATGVLTAALKNPELFKSITLMQPAGLSSGNTLGQLVKHTVKKTARNQSKALKGQKPHFATKDSRYVAATDEESGAKMSARVVASQAVAGGLLAKNPSLAAKEAQFVADADISLLIQQVIQLGIPVNVVISQNDELFDSESNTQNINQMTSLPTSFSSVADPEAGHDTFWLQPKRTASIIGNLVLKS